jgi:glycosyltransferase involved in cell wall biosynthesis
MKVSVLIVTYNHEAYIAEAIQSVLMQAVDFDYEIVVGEDNSSDRTREIVSDFAKKHSAKIRVLLQDLADSERDRARDIGGKTNFVRALQACKGQYVALLDGDDYWTDIHKLQKQVDFLDSHADFAISCHNARVVYENDEKQPHNLCPADQKEVLTIEDLFFVNFIPTCSAVFRRGLFDDLPEWFYDLRIGDWPIHIMNAQHGKIGYSHEVMAVYRVHPSGQWSSQSLESARLEILKMLDHVDDYLDHKYRRQIKDAKAEWYYQLAQISYGEGDQSLGRTYLKLHLRFGGLQQRRNVLSILLRRRAPMVYRSLRALRDWLFRQPLKQ